MSLTPAGERVRYRVRVTGITQGVGFRPTVWRLAHRLDLGGWVQNDANGLLTEVEGPRAAVEAFCAELAASPPLLAQIDSVETVEINLEGDTEFQIRASDDNTGQSNPVTPDISICNDCLEELFDSNNRRFRYPFINCTNCGPRFSIIEGIPYDRPLTTMKSFPMCTTCAGEYADPANRRFHAQPNACHECGPQVEFVRSPDVTSSAEDSRTEPILGHSAFESIAIRVRAGEIAAIKGIGGFHLICDPFNEAAIAKLRERKGRIDKPFAMMVRDAETAAVYADMSEPEREILESKERPIVLLRKKRSSNGQSLATNIAPGNDFIGIMLPYSPMHYLLVDEVGPLLVTSGNLSNEPICKSNDEALNRLGRIADCFLLHNRDIHAVCDDSVVRYEIDRILPIRRSRGYSPMPVVLSTSGPSVLAIGGEIKATFCITRDRYAYMSQHIGDVSNVETLETMQQLVDHFQNLFRVKLDAVVGDSHPEYLSSQWARRFAQSIEVPYIEVQHHHAHAASLTAESNVDPTEPIIACSFDGTGFGPDGTIWGGEFLLTSPTSCERLAYLDPFPLPGGDACVKRPSRTAMSLLSRADIDWDPRLPSVAATSDVEQKVLRKLLASDATSPRTSSMGRLFDAVASLIGVRHAISYEAQAAMELEALASDCNCLSDREIYTFSTPGPLGSAIDWRPVIRSICADVTDGVAKPLIAARFHQAVAGLIADICRQVRLRTGVNVVGLTGGVFQNVLLLRLSSCALREAGFRVLTHSIVPANDGGLALGQAVVTRQTLISADTSSPESDGSQKRQQRNASESAETA